MSASAAEIRLSADRQDVLVPVETFKVWQEELEKYDVLQRYVARLEEEINSLRDAEAVREALLAQERRVADAEIARWVAAHNRADKRSKSPGLGIGAGYGSNGEFIGMIGIVWKPFW